MGKYLWRFAFFSSEKLVCNLLHVTRFFFVHVLICRHALACVCFTIFRRFLCGFCCLMTEPFKFRPLPKVTDFRGIQILMSVVIDIIQLWLLTKYILIYNMAYRISHADREFDEKKVFLKQFSKR